MTKNHSKPNNDKDNRHIQVFDTTLRDGQQCPGAGMSFENNIEYARLACQLKIDVLEAGFPSASSLDFSIVRTIAEEITRSDFQPIVAGLCQLREEQVTRTIEALAPLIPFHRARVHIYLPVDPDLMPVSLGARSENKEQLVRDLFNATKLAVDAGCEVEFSPEGYSRMRENFDFTTELIRATIQAGGKVINCPDTIGGACEIQGKEYFVERMKEHAAIIEREFPDRNVIWSTHCHNDLGLAVQNTINAVFHGPARQIEGCINGVGERAGNASLEQCIMLIKQFGGHLDKEKPFYTTIATEKLQAISDFVGQNMLPRQPQWPVTGDNAAKHSSGGHTNAILKNPLAYQPFNPTEIGKEISFVFGPFSGSNHAQSIIESFGCICTDAEKAEITQFVKNRYSERRKGITDKELMQAYFEFRAPIQIDRIDYSKNAENSTVKMHGKFFDTSGAVEETNSGKDSALAAVKSLIETKFGPIQILHHESRSESVGHDACSISRILILDKENLQHEGVGKDQDIKISAIRALIDAVNRAYIDKSFSMIDKKEKAIEQGQKSPFVS